MYEELFQNEIQLKDDECCIIFDFGCYFPYANPEVLHFRFTVGEKEFDDIKLNHRYPNKNYQTISRKYGRKLSKLGYPYVMKLSDQPAFTLLRLDFGIKDCCISYIFPLQTNMTKDKPVCALSLRLMLDEPREGKLQLLTYEKTNGPGWNEHRWFNCTPQEFWECKWTGNDSVLSTPTRLGNSNTLMYHELITPSPSTLSELLI